jgi:hypothetical protein
VSERIPYAVAWALCSLLLLSLGFVTVVALAAVVAARGDPAHAPQALVAFGVYAKVVLAKGLLPALAIALALWAWLDRGGRLAQRGWRVRALGLLAAATLGSVAAAGLLLPLSIPGLPPVRFTGAANFVRTCLEMAVPVALAAWLPQWILPRVRRHASLLLAGLLVVFLAGGASVARLARSTAGRAAPPADVPREQIEPGDLAIVDRLLAEGDPMPVYADGALMAMELRSVRPGGLYARIGLRNGDRVGAIGGVALGSPGLAGALQRALRESREIELSVERSDGTPARITVSSDELLGALGASE